MEVGRMIDWIVAGIGFAIGWTLVRSLGYLIGAIAGVIE